MSTKTTPPALPAPEPKGGPPPKVGSDIYLPSALYMSHGRDDFRGGLCKVVAVSISISAGDPTYFVEVEGRPGYTKNWALLRDQQDQLKADYGPNRGHADPDDDPSANDGW